MCVVLMCMCGVFVVWGVCMWRGRGRECVCVWCGGVGGCASV